MEGALRQQMAEDENEEQEQKADGGSSEYDEHWKVHQRSGEDSKYVDSRKAERFWLFKNDMSLYVLHKFVGFVPGEVEQGNDGAVDKSFM